MTIGDLLTEVALELGNRADITAGTPSRVANWIKQSYLNIGMSYPMSELEMSTNDQFVKGIGDYSYPSDARAIIAYTAFWPDEGTASGAAIKLDIKDIAYIRQFNNSVEGPPSVIAFHNLKTFIRPFPDQTYPVTIDYWQKPQISDDVVSTDLNVPDDWLEIVTLGAVMRGHIALVERDKAQSIQQLLFGYSMPNTGRAVPGLIAQAMTRRQAQAPRMDYGMQPTSVRRSFTNQG